MNKVISREYVEKNYIHKDKIKEALNIPLDEETNTDLVSLIKTIFDECERLEDIEDRKVQIEYENVFNKGVNYIKDKIKEKLELLKDILKAKEKDGNIYKQISIEYLKGAIEQLEELLEDE
jgi:hypothetical protein